jgi:hypothetical protein
MEVIFWFQSCFFQIQLLPLHSGCRAQATVAVYECNIWLHDKSVKAHHFKCRDLLLGMIDECEVSGGGGGNPYSCRDAHEENAKIDAVSRSKKILTSVEEASCRVCGIVRSFVQHGVADKDGYSPHYVKSAPNGKGSNAVTISEKIGGLGAGDALAAQKQMVRDSDEMASALAAREEGQRHTEYDPYPFTSSATLQHAAFLGVTPSVPEEDVQLEASMFPVCEPLQACHPKCQRAVRKTIVACTRWMHARDAADAATLHAARFARAKCEAFAATEYGDAACDAARDSRENCFESVATGFRVLLNK